MCCILPHNSCGCTRHVLNITRDIIFQNLLFQYSEDFLLIVKKVYNIKINYSKNENKKELQKLSDKLCHCYLYNMNKIEQLEFIRDAILFHILLDVPDVQGLIDALSTVYEQLSVVYLRNLRYGEEIDHYCTEENCHRIVYHNGFVKYYFPESLKDSLVIDPGEYIYRINLETSQETLVEFIPLCNAKGL
nr:MAG TPA: hypothetical protein [Caudoviricetes sp.]